MKNRVLLLALTLCAISNTGVMAAPGPYKLTAKTPIPGEGEWDYLTVDPMARLLYISHSTQVDVYNMDQKKIVGQVANTPGVHGIAIVPALGRGFTSNGKADSVTAFDLKSFAAIQQIPVNGKNPDAILYDPATEKLFTFNGKSNDATVIDPKAGKVIGLIPLGGKPEFAVSDGQGLVFDNLEDKSELVAIDAKTLTVKHRYPVAPCEEPSSLAFDTANRRLFLGCGNHKMAVVNADNGKVVTTVPIGDHVDATVFDADRKLVFNSNGEGTVTVVQQDGPDQYHVVENVKTQAGARTVALDPQSHALYLVSAEFGPKPAATAEEPHPRPKIMPGTFVLLTVSDAQH